MTLANDRPSTVPLLARCNCKETRGQEEGEYNHAEWIGNQPREKGGEYSGKKQNDHQKEAVHSTGFRSGPGRPVPHWSLAPGPSRMANRRALAKLSTRWAG